MSDIQDSVKNQNAILAAIYNKAINTSYTLPTTQVNIANPLNLYDVVVPLSSFGTWRRGVTYHINKQNNLYINNYPEQAGTYNLQNQDLLYIVQGGDNGNSNNPNPTITNTLLTLINLSTFEKWEAIHSYDPSTIPATITITDWRKFDLDIDNLINRINDLESRPVGGGNSGLKFYIRGTQSGGFYNATEDFTTTSPTTITSPTLNGNYQTVFEAQTAAINTNLFQSGEWTTDFDLKTLPSQDFTAQLTILDGVNVIASIEKTFLKDSTKNTLTLDFSITTASYNFTNGNKINFKLEAKSTHAITISFITNTNDKNLHIHTPIIIESINTPTQNALNTLIKSFSFSNGVATLTYYNNTTQTINISELEFGSGTPTGTPATNKKIYIDTTNNLIYANISNTWVKTSASIVDYSRMQFVDVVNGNDTNSGSQVAPKKTTQAAHDAFPNDTNYKDIIVLIGNETNAITISKSNVRIVGQGGLGRTHSTFSNSMTISGTGFTLDGFSPTGANGKIIVQGTATNTILNNITTAGATDTIDATLAGGFISVNNLDFGATTQKNIKISGAGTVYIYNSANATYSFGTITGLGFAKSNSPTVKLSGTLPTAVLRYTDFQVDNVIDSSKTKPTSLQPGLYIFTATPSDGLPTGVTADSCIYSFNGTNYIKMVDYDSISACIFSKTENLSYCKDAGTFKIKANVVSPAFTGTPTAPTAVTGTNTTQIATTAFVANGLNLKQDKVFTYTVANLTALNAITGMVSGNTAKTLDTLKEYIYTTTWVLQTSSNGITTNEDSATTSIDFNTILTNQTVIFTNSSKTYSNAPIGLSASLPVELKIENKTTNYVEQTILQDNIQWYRQGAIASIATLTWKQILTNDSIQKQGIIDILSTPPVSSLNGDAYIVGTSPTGAWSSFAVNNIAKYNASTSSWSQLQASTYGIVTFNDATNASIVSPIYYQGGSYKYNTTSNAWEIYNDTRTNQAVLYVTGNITLSSDVDVLYILSSVSTPLTITADPTKFTNTKGPLYVINSSNQTCNALGNNVVGGGAAILQKDALATGWTYYSNTTASPYLLDNITIQPQIAASFARRLKSTYTGNIATFFSSYTAATTVIPIDVDASSGMAQVQKLIANQNGTWVVLSSLNNQINTPNFISPSTCEAIFYAAGIFDRDCFNTKGIPIPRIVNGRKLVLSTTATNLTSFYAIIVFLADGSVNNGIDYGRVLEIGDNNNTNHNRANKIAFHKAITNNTMQAEYLSTKYGSVNCNTFAGKQGASADLQILGIHWSGTILTMRSNWGSVKNSIIGSISSQAFNPAFIGMNAISIGSDMRSTTTDAINGGIAEFIMGYNTATISLTEWHSMLDKECSKFL